MSNEAQVDYEQNDKNKPCSEKSLKQKAHNGAGKNYCI
jgi:hypothetical protein